MAVLTLLIISLNFEAGNREIGRYPLAKILIAMCIHTAGLSIPCIVQYIYLTLFLSITVNLWSNDVNPMNFCIK